jgi:predicted RNase H-like nuclease (RuvC/YqgF family)
MGDLVHKLTDIRTALAVLQSENARLKDCARVNAEREAHNAETRQKNYEGWRRKNLRLQTELLASQEKVFELQNKLLALRAIVNSVTVAGQPLAKE